MLSCSFDRQSSQHRLPLHWRLTATLFVPNLLHCSELCDSYGGRKCDSKTTATRYLLKYAIKS